MRILLATDGSAHASVAEALLQSVKPWREATIVVAAVAVPPTPLMASFMPTAETAYAAQYAELWTVLRAEAQKHLDAAAQRLRAKGMNVETRLLEGDVAACLAECAEKEQCSLIAVGSRGQGGFASFLLGSVARNLVNGSKTSVLVARHDEHATPEATAERIAQLERLSVLVGIDGSDGSKAAVSHLVGYGPETFGDMYALCALPLSPLPIGIEPELVTELVDLDRKHGEEVAREIGTNLQHCCDKVTCETIAGRSAEVLIEEARRKKVDLVAVGATRHGTLERLLIGSVAYEVATSAPCSVLVIRPAA